MVYINSNDFGKEIHGGCTLLALTYSRRVEAASLPQHVGDELLVFTKEENLSKAEKLFQ